MRLEEEITQFKKKLDEGSIKSKFENSSRILDDILSSQRPSGDRSGLGFVKEKRVFLSQIKREVRKAMVKYEILHLKRKEARNLD